MKKKLLLFILLCPVVLSLVGCGQGSEQLTMYQEKMEQYTQRIDEINTNINLIDVNADDATDSALLYLEEMEEVFIELAALDVPPEFLSAENLSDEAAEYMSDSVDAYHTLFTSSSYDEYAALLAEESYSRAMKRQYYIGEILQGKVPEGDNITIVGEDDSIESTDTNSENSDLPTEDLLDTE